MLRERRHRFLVLAVAIIPMRFPARLAYTPWFLLRLHRADHVLRAVIPIVMLAFLPGQIRLRSFVVLLLVDVDLVPRHLLAPGPLRADPAAAVALRLGARVRHLGWRAWGKSMSWIRPGTPGSSPRRFLDRDHVASGSVAVLWLAWSSRRTATQGSRSSPSCCSSACSTSRS